MPPRLKDWFTFRRLFCQHWQFRNSCADTARWIEWNLNCADTKTMPTPKHKSTTLDIFNFVDMCSNNSFIGIKSFSSRVKNQNAHAVSKQETTCFKSMKCRKMLERTSCRCLSAGLHLGHSFMLLWKCQPEADCSYHSTSTTVEPFPWYLAEIPPQRRIKRCGCCRYEQPQVKPCWTMEDKNKNIKLRETVLLQTASLQLAILARPYEW